MKPPGLLWRPHKVLFCLFSCDLSSEKVMFCFCLLSSCPFQSVPVLRWGLLGGHNVRIVQDDSPGRAGLRSHVQSSELPRTRRLRHQIRQCFMVGLSLQVY